MHNSGSCSFILLATACAGALSITGSPRAARAQDPPPLELKRPEWQISLGTGISFALTSNLHIVQRATDTDATFHNVNWDGHPFEGSPYHNVRVAAFLPRHPRLGVMIDFLHYKVYARVGESKLVTGTWLGQPVNEVAPIDERVQYFRISNGVNVFTEGVLYRQSFLRSSGFPSGRLQPYVGGGISEYLLYGINTVGNQNNLPHRYQWNGLGFSLNGGARYGISRHFAAYLESRYTSGDGKVKIADGGTGQTPLRTFHLAFGLSTDF